MLATWFYSYSADLPELQQVSSFAPAAAGIIRDECLGSQVMIIPQWQLTFNLKNAIDAAEIRNNTDTAGYFSAQIARTLFCDSPDRPLQRRLKEMRAAAQLQRKFTVEQLMLIYANRVYLGNGVTGVESASHRFFGKSASELTVAEAAMIAGLLKSPAADSPDAHPDRATKRRDEVIELMLARGFISAEEAFRAKQSALRD